MARAAGGMPQPHEEPSHWSGARALTASTPWAWWRASLRTPPWRCPLLQAADRFDALRAHPAARGR
jgi:hypothetical protein